MKKSKEIKIVLTSMAAMGLLSGCCHCPTPNTYRSYSSSDPEYDYDRDRDHYHNTSSNHYHSYPQSHTNKGVDPLVAAGAGAVAGVAGKTMYDNWKAKKDANNINTKPRFGSDSSSSSNSSLRSGFGSSVHSSSSFHSSGG